MTFRKRIYAIIILPVVLLGAVLLLYAWASSSFEEKEKNHYLSRQLSSEILNLSFAADRYFIYRHQGIYDYWVERHKVLEQFLSQVKGEDRRETVLLREIGSNNTKIQDLFQRLLQVSESDEKRLEERLLEAILLKSRMMYSDSVRIEQSSARKLEALRHSIVFYAMLAGVLITISITVVAVHLTKRVIKNIDLLREGTQKIAAGDLDVRVDVHTADELGALANSFNDMSQRLKKSLMYTENSMKALEIENKMTKRAEEEAKRETEERKRAESALKQLNADLEARVRERTEEVRKSNALLEKMKEHADRETYQARVAAEQHRAHHLKLQRLIAEMGKILSSTTVEETLRLIVAIARDITGSRYCVIGHGLSEDTFTVKAAAKGPNDPACRSSAVYTPRGGVYQELLEHPEPTVLTDKELKHHPQWRGTPEGHCRLRGLIAVPIRGSGDEVIGMLMATDKTDGTDYTAEDEMLLTQLAVVASMTMRCMNK